MKTPTTLLVLLAMAFSSATFAADYTQPDIRPLKARRNGRYVGICGQAPSDYPEMAAYLIELGIVICAKDGSKAT